jgi:hypothetical protein
MPTQTTLWRPGPLDALLGAWAFEITQEGQPVMRGRSEFARVEGGAFLLQHATADFLPTTPDVWRENSPFPIATVMGTAIGSAPRTARAGSATSTSAAPRLVRMHESTCRRPLRPVPRGR